MNIRFIEEGNRLHLIFEGIDNPTQVAIKGMLAAITGSMSMSSETVDDFENIEPAVDEQELITEVDESKIESDTKQETDNEINQEELLKKDYADGFQKYRERFFFSSFKNYKDMGNINKKAYTSALKEWILSYFENDPYIEKDKSNETMKNHRGFFKIFKDLIPSEIQSCEKQFGYEEGTLAESASNDEIMMAFDACRKALIERAAK